MPFLKDCRVVILGAPGVGKSSLVIRFTRSDKADSYDPTFDGTYRAQRMIDDEVVLMDILFLSGPHLYTAMLEQMARQGETFLLTYSITSRDSLLAVRQDYELVRSAKQQAKFPFVVVGLKRDLSATERQVPEADGIALAQELGGSFLEVSARESVDEAFDAAIRAWRRHEALVKAEEEQQRNNNLGPVAEISEQPAPERRRARWKDGSSFTVVWDIRHEEGMNE